MMNKTLYNIGRAIDYFEKDIPINDIELNTTDLIEYIVKLKSESLDKKEVIEMLDRYINDLHLTAMEKDLELKDILEHFSHLLNKIKNTNYSIYNY